MKVDDKFYREVYKRVAASGQAARIECASEGAAKQLRLKFYRAIRSVREKPEEDLELAKALDEVTMTIDPEDRKVLIVRQHQLTPVIANLAKQLGIDMSKLESPEEKAAREMGERMHKQFGGEAAEPDAAAPETERPKNPYFTRD